MVIKPASGSFMQWRCPFVCLFVCSFAPCPIAHLAPCPIANPVPLTAAWLIMSIHQGYILVFFVVTFQGVVVTMLFSIEFLFVFVNKMTENG